MKIGVPREIRHNEYRVAATPATVRELVVHGHQVEVECDAGMGSGFRNEEYTAAGARIAASASEVWAGNELILKVKKPIEEEFHRLRPDHVLFAYLHLAVAKDCTDALIEAGTTAIGYETVEDEDGAAPLLAPMSEIAGRLAPHWAAQFLLRSIAGRSGAGGMGIVMGGVMGAPPAKVAVIGAGVAGRHAISAALGMMADVTALDCDVGQLHRVMAMTQGRCKTMPSTVENLERSVLEADVVIAAVLARGCAAPKLVANGLAARMKPGAVVIDLSIDQGGCFEASRSTSLDAPTFQFNETVFSCVPNMPSAVPRTSTLALTTATLPHILAVADCGWKGALRRDRSLARGLNTHAGSLTCREVSDAHDYPHRPVNDVLA
jgi:alanine dehydrogenase